MYKSKLFLAGETFVLIFLPLLLLRFRPELIHFRKYVMLASLVYVYLVMRLGHFSFQQMGITIKNFKKSVKALILPTCGVITLMIMLGFSWLGSLTVNEIIVEQSGKAIYIPILLYFFMSVPLQEFIFRGFYINRLKMVSDNNFFLIIYSSIIFGLIHLPFENKLVAVGAFFLSLYWSYIFIKYGNLISVSISHFMIGIPLILFTLLK